MATRRPTEADIIAAHKVLDDWENRRTPEDHRQAVQADKLLAGEWNRRRVTLQRRTTQHFPRYVLVRQARNRPIDSRLHSAFSAPRAIAA